MSLSAIDWWIIALYLAGMIALSIYLARNQKNKKDYYLGGNNSSAWSIAISTMATQCSTNSILGAPAFVAFSVGGGLVWLQYELAVPFAMIFLMIFLLPLYRRLGIISVYAYLEKRFDYKTRLSLSLLFQFVRAFAAGVIIYGISLVISFCTGISFVWAVILLGVITIVYDSIGGMRAVIVSDVIQMIVLYLSIVGTILIALDINGGISETLASFDQARRQTINFSSHGFDGNSFAFLPLLLGGFFLYVSYYGCDQTQVQRELSTKNVDDTNFSLFLNGILRFPLVLTYCFLGVCIGAYAKLHPEFLSLLPLTENAEPQFNLAVPVFVIKYFPVGAVGLFMVGLFSAAMSSLDSTINSLSATTMQDVIKPLAKDSLSEKQELYLSKGLTIFWGSLCTLFSFYVGNISDSIVVSINKIGSLANGPILGVFLLGVLTRKACGTGAIAGLIFGFVFNSLCWLYFPKITWPWWNVTGCLATFVFGYFLSFLLDCENKDLAGLVYNKIQKQELGFKVNWKKYYALLATYGFVIFFFCLWVQ